MDDMQSKIDPPPPRKKLHEQIEFLTQYVWLIFYILVTEVSFFFRF